MTLEQLIAQQRAAIAANLAARATATALIESIRGALMAAAGRAPTDDETTQIRNAQAEQARLDTERSDVLQPRLAELEAELTRDQAAADLATQFQPAAPAPGFEPRAHVVNEERTYTREKNLRGETSFFRDAYAAEFGNDFQARGRLERHAQEVRVEGELTERAASTGSFAGLIVPQYLVDQAALIARAGRPFANTCVHLQLPEEGMSLVIPRGTTGAAVSVQATENSSVQNTDEVMANLTVPVVTIAGQQDLSRQSLERGTPGIDQLVYMDLAGAYAVSLDAQVIAGTGSSGQMIGVLNASGVGQATAFTAAATVATFYSKVAGQINGVETLRFMAPTAIAMHPRRWNWLIAQLDPNNRPLVVPADNGPFNSLASFDGPIDTPSVSPAGGLLGIPTITDANIPTAVGTGPEDQVIVYRREDLLLWEDGDGMPKQLRFEQTLGNQLTVKLVAYNYAAFTAGRYPAAVGIVGGNAGSAGYGLIAPTF